MLIYCVMCVIYLDIFSKEEISSVVQFISVLKALNKKFKIIVYDIMFNLPCMYLISPNFYKFC